MDYKRELRKMKNHRRQYYPAVKRLMELYNRPGIEFPVDILADDDALILMELLDIGYLDEETLIVKKRFGSITSLFFTGKYPLTEVGENLYRRGLIAGKRRYIVMLFSVALVLLTIIIVIRNCA